MAVESDGLDLQSAADEIGVHYQTAYRWVRSGRLPAVTVDGKYRIERRDLDALIRDRLVPRPPAAPTARRMSTASEAMYHALVAGDEAGATAVARRIVDDSAGAGRGGAVTDFIQQVLVPPLRRIGVDWSEGRVSVWQEHRASAITERILGEIARSPRGRRRGTAMVAAAEGDRHSVATTMAAVALRDHNWAVHHLGADVPNDELMEFCRRQPVDIAVITVTNPRTSAAAKRVATQIDTLGIATLVGGPGRTLDELVAAAGTARRGRSDASGRV